jgi:hypothetical protein
MTRKSIVREEFKGLQKTLSSPEFVSNIALFSDVLEEISILSQYLQKDSVNIPSSYRAITRSIRAIEQLKEMPGACMKEAEKAISEGCFKDVSLVPRRESSRMTTQINRKQFCQSLSDNLRQRLISNDSEEFKSFMKEIDILDSKKWPYDIVSPWLEGEENLRKMCDRFLLSYPNVREGFRDYIDNSGENIPENLKPVFVCVDTLPVSTSDCERGFSTMNLVMTTLRNSLSVCHLSSLMFISIVGPPLHLWNPEDYIKVWIKTHRHAEDNQCKKANLHVQQSDRYSNIWDLL